MKYLNLKENQARFLEKILETSETISEHWKILVYDEYSKRIISPVLSLQKLRKLGITLHLSLETKRESVPEVPVIYLIKPTQHNIKKICQDLSKNLYDKVHVHFIQPAVVEVGGVSKIKRVFDQFLGFTSLEKDLVSLELKNSFSSYNIPSLTENQVLGFMRSIVHGLVNILTTLSILPIIRCPRNGPSEYLAKLLNKKLRELHADTQFKENFLLNQHAARVTSPKNDESEIRQFDFEDIAFASKRPVLLITDRGIDLSTMLHHTSVYQTLIDDFFKINSNRVQLQSSTDSKPQVFGLNSDLDEFWSEFSDKIIPVAVENHSKQLNEVSEQVNKIKQKSSSSTNDEYEVSTEDQVSGTGSGLLKTVESLPKLLEKKKTLEKHLEIIKQTMSEVSKREIYIFSEVEDKILEKKGRYSDINEITKILDNKKYLFTDKIRLVSVLLLNSTSLDTSSSREDKMMNKVFNKINEIKQEIEQNEELKWTNEDEIAFKSLIYLKKVHSLTKNKTIDVSNSMNSSSKNDGFGAVWKLADKAAQGFLEAQQKVKGLVFSESYLPIVQMLDAVTRPIEVTDLTKSATKSKTESEMLYLDPNIGEEETPRHQRFHGEISSGIVFVIGGGCYAEYQNLRQYCYGRSQGVLGSMTGGSGKQNKKRFVYGCSEMLNATEFTQQLAKSHSG